jgi:hypothetical protein
MVEHGLGRDRVDDQKLSAALRSGDDADVAPRDVELVGHESDQGVVGGSFDGRCRDPRPQLTIDDAIHLVSR